MPRTAGSTLRVTPPPDFAFWHTVISHGWCELPPFAADREKRTLDCVLELPGGSPVACSVAQHGHALVLRVHGQPPMSAPVRRHLSRQLRTCLRLDESFVAFHRVARSYPRYRWIARARAGRLLRAPTVFEDVVKMICTTNCSWSGTTAMVEGILEEFGRPGRAGARAFPDPASIAGSSEAVLRRRCRTGYRAPYILDFARRVASGEVDCESWRSSLLSTDDLERELRSVRGMGPYAAGNLLKLLGRYDRLGLDSWVRARFAALHAHGRRVRDARIERHYAHLGEWRGLLFWLEMTRHWHNDKFPPGE